MILSIFMSIQSATFSKRDEENIVLILQLCSYIQHDIKLFWVGLFASQLDCSIRVFENSVTDLSIFHRYVSLAGNCTVFT